MEPYAELLEFNQPNPIRKEGFTRIRDAFPGLQDELETTDVALSEYHGHPHTAVYYNPERIMEFAGRWDYGQNNARKLGETSKIRVQPEQDARYDVQLLPYDKEVPILQKYLSMGHESMIEMGDATFFIECSRTCSHELVRHRLASFQQESQRFTSYKDEMPDDFFFVAPEFLENDLAKEALVETIRVYEKLVEQGMPKQIARYILPNATRTRLIMKANAREWRHILKLRLDKSAQPEMQLVARQIYDQLVDIFPNAMSGILDGERGTR